MKELIEKRFINDSLQKAICPKCQKSLAGAEVYTVAQEAMSLLAHATCNNCKTSSMVTISALGTGLMPLKSDMVGTEFKEFMNKEIISYDEIIDLHQKIKKVGIWNLLDNKDN